MKPMKLKSLLRPLATFGLTLALVAGAASSAGAVTLHDLMALSQAGLSDAVLIALIETDQTIYGVSPDQLLALKRAGVGEPVILALLRNGRARATEAPQPPAQAAVPAPSPADNGVVIVGDHSSPPATAPTVEPSVIVVPAPVFYPVAVPVYTRRPGRPHRPARQPVASAPAYTGFGRFINNGFASSPSSILNGNVVIVNGLRIVTPRVVAAKVPGQK